MTSDLPCHSSALEEKLDRKQKSYVSWTRPYSLPIPGVRTRRLRIYLPNPATLSNVRMSRMRRKRGPLLVVLACLAIFLTFSLSSRSFERPAWTEGPWIQSEPFDKPTLIFQRAQLQRIWKWEIASGHYPSHQPIPAEIEMPEPILNPGIPRRVLGGKQKSNLLVKPDDSGIYTEGRGVGVDRVYPDIQSQPPNVAYPPRPIPGSVADMDIIMKHCDFSQGKYVRDCLEFLRIGGGLDNGNRLRREDLSEFKYIYLEQPDNFTLGPTEEREQAPLFRKPLAPKTERDPNEGLVKKVGVDWEAGINLPQPLKHRPSKSLSTPCDPENPRLFHMFWTGPFTDKPYLALMSFLYSQNTGIHLKEWPADASVCRPQFWLWINPGPAASVPNPGAVHDMFKQLKANPWASPFLHPRFKDVIQFKLWNTTEQFDSIPDIKDEWRQFKGNMFNSGGHIIKVKENITPASEDGAEGESDSSEQDDLSNRTGSKSSDTYDRLSVILSDTARFILCHRFGGVYLDADTIFLRDWEELWGWKGGFAYRWSRLPSYNTAVLRMNKGSALGTFLFRSALKNGLDFHPMTVSRYTADAHLEGLLLRLPDALFDAAWLNTEDYQRDRPPQPYFTEFAEFFDTSAQNSAAPAALGIRGFFRGSYSYHFHNFWWKPFDPTRNFPDLGPRFKAGEDTARAQLRKEKIQELAAQRQTASIAGTPAKEPVIDEAELNIESEPRDLNWSMVLKRTFEAYIRGETPNMYGEWIEW